MDQMPFENGLLGNVENIFHGQIALFLFHGIWHSKLIFIKQEHLTMTSFVWKMGDLENVLITLYCCCDHCKIFFKVKLCFFLSWHMIFKAHFRNTGASYHGPDSFQRWYIKLIFKAQKHLYNRSDPFWKWVTLKMLLKLHFILSWHVTLDTTGQGVFHTLCILVPLIFSQFCFFLSPSLGTTYLIMVGL